MNAGHPPPQELTDYASGKLDEDSAALVETHVAECPECEVTLQSIEANSDTIANNTIVQGLREAEKSPTEIFAREAEYQRAIEQAANLPEVTAIHGQPTAIPSTSPGQAAEQPLQKLGPYELVAKLGEGGMGAVYKAQHEHLGKTVAIKILPATALRDPALVGRFRREMKAVGALHHPNIVGAHDAGEAAGVHFLVMEYVAGEDLSTLLKENGPLSVEQAISCTLQTARGLEFAHRKGIVHRDIKPANLLLDEEGTLKILDMGLARLDDNAHNLAAQEGLTQTGQVMGTVDYMAPEQAFDTHRADAKADVYSLGCTLYRILTGQNAFAGDTIVQKILAHREKPIPSLRTLRPEVPAAFDKIFQRMMAKQPEDRIAMAEVVQEFAALQTAPPAPATKSFKLQQAPTTTVLQAAAPSSGGNKKPPVIWLAAGLGGAAAAILLTVIFIIRDKDGNEIARVNGPDGSSVAVQPGTTHENKTAPEKNVSPPATHGTSTNAKPTASGDIGLKFGEDGIVQDNRKFTNKFGMEFTLVPQGKSWLGGGGGKPGTEEYTQTQDFYLGTYEVTQEQWQRIMGKNHAYHRKNGRGSESVQDVPEADLPQFPMEAVSSDMALQFVDKLNELASEGGWTYRLPTEKEWEYACRGGPLKSLQESAYSYYFDKPSQVATPKQGRFEEKSAAGYVRPAKIGSYPPNRLGLFDMHGNIKEWCLNPAAGGENAERVMRGGSFSSGFKSSKATDRLVSELPANSVYDVGLRVARVPQKLPAASISVAPDMPREQPNPPAVKKFAFQQPDFAAWAAEVGRRDPDMQLAMVLKKLQELNPAYDGEETHRIQNNGVVELNLPATKIADLSPVRALTDLKILKCGGEDKNRGLLESLAPLQGMKLDRLECYYTNVADLSPLRGIPLKELICFGTKVADLNPLEGMPLTTLWIYDNPSITDLSPLESCRQLKKLELGNRYSVAEIDKLQKALPHCTIIADPSSP